MNFGNLMSAFEMKPSGIIGWVTIVIAVLGLSLFFGDLIINIKKRRNTRLNIIGLVFISLSLVCFILTMVFSEMELIFTFIALAFMVGYFVCDVIVAVCIGKQNKREGKPIWRKPKKSKVEKPEAEAPETISVEEVTETSAEGAASEVDCETLQSAADEAEHPTTEEE